MAEEAFTMGVGDVLGQAAGKGSGLAGASGSGGMVRPTGLDCGGTPLPHPHPSSPLPLLQQRVTPCPVAVELLGAGGAASADTVPSVW